MQISDNCLVAFHKDSRTIILMGEIDPDSTYEFLTAVVDLSSERAKEPVRLIINSPGGHIIHAFAMYDALKGAPFRTTGIVVGECCSAATIVLQACHNRLMSPNSTFMIHVGTSFIGAKHHNEAVTDMKEIDRMSRAADELVAKRAGIPLKKYRKLQIFGRYFTAQEAVEYNFADKVVGGA